MRPFLCTLLLPFLCLTALAACGTSATTTDAATTDTADAAPLDTAGTDAAAADVADGAVADALADALPAEVTGADTQVVDVPPPDAAADADVGNSCAALLGQIAALKPMLTGCTPATGCKTMEYPICNTFGCFQTPMASDADSSALESLAKQASSAGCDGFHCGCDQPKPAFCLKGQCRQCPPDCDGTCDELTAALLSAAHAANWCSTDNDCTAMSTGLCPVGDLPCGGMYVNSFANAETLQAIIGGYSVACGPSFCKCAVPGPAVCVKGKCVAK